MKKKNSKLALQISLIVTVMFILALLLIGTIVLRGTKRMYFQSQNEKIRSEIDESRFIKINPAIVNLVLDQWEKDDKLLFEPLTQEETNQIEAFQASRFGAEMDTMEKIGEMSEEERRSYFKSLYYCLAAWMDDRREDGHFDRCVLVDLKPTENMDWGPGFGTVVLDCSEETGKTSDYGLGWPLGEEDGYGFLGELEQASAEEKNGCILFREPSGSRQNYTAVAPAWINGSLRYAVCLEYDYSVFTSILRRNVRSIALWGGVSLLIVNALLVFFIYRRAVRPLVQVDNGIHAYMKTKDSDAAVQSMSRIRERNEVGRLADSIAAMAVEIDRSNQENLRLHGERERAMAELNLAAKIQMDSLPTVFPDRRDIQMSASMVPAKEVGGDFYDFFFIDEDHLGLVIADVSGKGVPAALFMMMSKNLIKNYAMLGLSPAEVLNRTNASLCENNRNKMFVTVWFGILDLTRGHVVAANGGHEYPMLRKANGGFELFREKHGMVLGALKRKTYAEYEFDLEPGGTLFVYTDGAPEATDAQEKMFGTDRMLDTLNRQPGAEPETLLQVMKAAIDQFVGDAPQFDDLTMLCVKYLPDKEETT